MSLRRTLLLFLCIAFFATPLLSHAQAPIDSNMLGNCPDVDVQGHTRLSVHIPGISERKKLVPGILSQAIEAGKAAATPGGQASAVTTAIKRVNKVNSEYCYYVKGDLVDYIKGLYTFGLTVGGFLAVVMIMIGGIIWAGAGGNPELIKKGQGRVLNAIFGLVLLLASYTILNLINPDLVKLERINPDPTSAKDLTLEDILKKTNPQGLTREDVTLKDVAKIENYMKDIGKELSNADITKDRKKFLDKEFEILRKEKRKLDLQAKIQETERKLAASDNSARDTEILKKRLNELNENWSKLNP